jgi:hypothetical protein
MNALTLFVLLAAPAAAPADSTGIAMLGVRASHGVEASLAQLLDEALLVTLKKSGVYSSILGSSDVAQMLDHDQQKSILGCEEDSCLAEVGGALGVPYLGSCTLGKLGDRYLITLKVISTEDSKVLSRTMRQVDNEGGLVEAVQGLVEEVNKEVRKAMPQEAAAPAVAKGDDPPAKKKRFFALSLGATGLGALVAGAGMYVQVDAQSAFDSAKADGVSAAEVDQIENDFAFAHQLIGGGAGLLVLGLAGLLL